MKVGFFALVISLFLALPAMAGQADFDGDTVPDKSDNCPTRANAGQSDVDSDGTGDVCDNCLTLFQTAADNCDSDTDGYGNACDGDFNQDNIVGVPDLNFIFVPNFLSTVPPAGATNDMNCDNIVGVPDLNFHFVPLFLGVQGPSGLSCAGSTGCL